jgi:hypothetical protein
LFFLNEKEAIMANAIRSSEAVRFNAWADQLARLVRTAWTGDDGRCYAPYMPLTSAAYWRQEVTAAWSSGDMHSWMLAVGERLPALVEPVQRIIALNP